VDYPRDEIVQKAEDAIRLYGGPSKASVHFKFSCEKCGTRCTFEKPNTLYASGTCYACGHETVVDKAGFSLALDLTPSLAHYPPENRS